MAVKIVVDIDRITLNDLEFYEKFAKEKGDELTDAQGAKEILWKFCVGDDGQYMREAEAREFVGNLGIGTAAKAMQEFFKLLAELKGTQEIPPTKGRRSTPRSGTKRAGRRG